MQNKVKNIFLPVAALSFVVILSLTTFLLININKNNKETSQLEENLETESRRREEIRSLDRSMDFLAKDRALLDTHFAKSTDVVPFLDTLEKIAPKVGSTTEVDSVDTNEDNTGLIVGVRTTGSFESVFKFISLLENAPYEMEFISVDFHKVSSSADGKIDKSFKWEAIMKIKLLSFIY